MPALLNLRRPAASPDLSALHPEPDPDFPDLLGNTPDWSEPTLKLLSELSPLERRFVEFFATGRSAAESYRLATGIARPSARQQAHKIRVRPHVQAAIAAAMGDRNLSCRLDREWMLQRLQRQIEECEESPKYSDKRLLLDAIMAVAKLQGYLGGRSAK